MKKHYSVYEDLTVKFNPAQDPTLVCWKGDEEVERIGIQDETIEHLHEMMAERGLKKKEMKRISFDFTLKFQDDPKKLMEEVEEKMTQFGVFDGTHDPCQECLSITDVHGKPVDLDFEVQEPAWPEMNRFPLRFEYDEDLRATTVTTTSTETTKKQKRRRRRKEKKNDINSEL